MLDMNKIKFQILLLKKRVKKYKKKKKSREEEEEERISQCKLHLCVLYSKIMIS